MRKQKEVCANCANSTRKFGLKTGAVFCMVYQCFVSAYKLHCVKYERREMKWQNGKA